MSTLHIVADANLQNSKNTLSIPNELKKHRQDSEQIFSEFTKFSYEVRGVEVFQPIVQYVVSSRYEQLDELILLYYGIQARIDDDPPARIVIGKGVEPQYRVLIEDVVDGEVTIVDNSEDHSQRDRTFWSFIRTIIFLLEHFILSFYPRTSRSSAETILLDDKSMNPIIDEFDRNGYDYDLLTKSSNLKSLLGGQRPQTETIHNYISIRPFLKELRFFITFIHDVYLSKSFSKEFNQFLRAEVGADLPRTSDYVIRSILANNVLERYRHGFATQALLKGHTCEALVVGSLSASGRAILLEANKWTVDTYHVPHSVITPGHVSVEGVEHFIAGELDLRYLRDLPHEKDLSKYHAYGQPYFYDLYREWGQSGTGEYTNTVLIATQPVPNRFEFVQSVINAVQTSTKDYDIVIKIHPGEDISDYRQFEDSPVVESVVDDKLFQRLSKAELVVTINSNVGFEGMIIGTPCISVNFWKQTAQFSYIKYGPVPIFDNPTELENFFVDLTEKRVDELRRKQKLFAMDHLELVEDPAPIIVDHIVEGD